MINFSNYVLEKSNDGFNLILYINPSSEFANEVGNNKSYDDEGFIIQVKSFISSKFPNLKITGVKILIGTTLMSSFIVTPALAESGNYYNYFNYTVKAGDSLWLIAKKYNTSIDIIKSINNLDSDMIYVGQKLVILKNTNIVSKQPTPTATEPTITYINHTVKQGDNAWTLSIEYGIPMTELLEVNNLTMNSSLSIGQTLAIPVHNIPIKTTVSEKHGELLDWWTEAQYVFTIGTVAKVTDFETGKSFYVKRTIGANHADTEPLTANDAAIIKDIWGGEYSWDKRAVIVEVDGRKIAASMSSMPHDIQYIYDNNFDGHFDIHFLNSTRHSDGQITESHQDQIKIAAGI